MGKGRQRVDFWMILSDYPPVFVRLMARIVTTGKHVRALSNSEIALMSNIPLGRVWEVSRMLTWDTVTLGEFRQFCAGCGFDPTSSFHRNRFRSYSDKCKKNTTITKSFMYLRKSPYFEKELKPLITLMGKYQKLPPTSSKPLIQPPSQALRLSGWLTATNG